MRALVTGGTGFVGSQVVRALVEDGVEVRVLARPGSDRRALADLPVEVVTGDLAEPPSLAAPLRGVETLYHVAADYRLWAPDPTVLYRVNVGGTRALLLAAAAAGVSRVVYTSSVGTLGLPPDGGPGTEATPVQLEDMVGDYKRSKYLAEREAEAAAARGLPVVIVNPSAPIGPWDWKPTPTGRMLVDYLKGRMLAYLDTGLNLVHVRDVARGHLLAAERGRPGERYILGHGQGNLALRASACRTGPRSPSGPAPSSWPGFGGPSPRWRGPPSGWRRSACISIRPRRSGSSGSPRRPWTRRSGTRWTGSGRTVMRRAAAAVYNRGRAASPRSARHTTA
jgi:dihydroflavonol-4-reductase